MIPKKIFQTWKTKKLEGKMAHSVANLQKRNPDYEYHLFDDNDCIQYLQTHYGDLYVRAFKMIRQGSFKADLWRYAVLYREGGVYLDIDMKVLVRLDTILGDENTELITSIDRRRVNIIQCAIYQAFLACKTGHPVVYHALQLSLYSILSYRVPTYDYLEITGPIAFGSALNMYWNKGSHDKIDKGVYNNGKIILYHVDEEVKYTYNEKGRKIIQNKIDGYDENPSFTLSINNLYYHNQPTETRKYRFVDHNVIRFEKQLIYLYIILLAAYAFSRYYKIVPI